MIFTIIGLLTIYLAISFVITAFTCRKLIKLGYLKEDDF